METTINNRIGKGEYYTEESKEFLAAYFNQAIHNVFIVLNHIAKRFGMDELSSDEELKNWLIGRQREKKRNAIDRQRFLELIDRHFPFLRIANADKKDAKRENDLEDNLALLITLLNDLTERRNKYSHAITHASIESNDRELVWRLYSIYDANINLVKRDYFESNVHTEINEDPYEKQVEHLRRFCMNNDRTKVDEKGKKKPAMPNPRFRTPFLNAETNQLSIYGLVFFVSLFLEKKYAIQMQKNVYGLKDARDTKFKMTNEVFCRSRIIMPRVRLHSDKSTDALVLDMLNELAKAPEVLFDQLTDPFKEKFYIESIDSLEESDIITPVRAIRKQNRFMYFALRYLDESNAFSKLRFQIDLGNYHYHLYESKINDQTESRHLTRKLFGFGKLIAFEQEFAPEEWKMKSKDLDYYEGATQPFIAKTYPHYHLEENKIGILFNGQAEVQWPHLDVEEHESFPKYKRRANEKADAFLSGNELLAAAFCHHLYASIGKPNTVEKIIRDKYHALRQLFSDLKSGNLQNLLGDNTSNEAISQLLFEKYRLTLSEVPVRLHAFLSGQEQADTKAIARGKLELMAQQNKKRIERFDAMKKAVVKVGKAQYRTLRSGDIGDWLVRDFMRFQPIGYKRNQAGKQEPDLKSKANPKKYQLIQKSLALYEQEKNNLLGLFKSCNLLSSENEHPFLNEVVQSMPATWQDFYERYLHARSRFLEKCIEKGIKKNSYQACYSFLKIKPQLKDKEKLYQGWDAQMNLPTNMFIDAIHDWFRQTHHESLRTWFTQQEKPHQLIGLIRKYIELAHTDQIQGFYDMFPLRYDFYKKEFPNGLVLHERINKQKQIWEAQLIQTKKRLEDAASKLKKVKQQVESLPDQELRFRNETEAMVYFTKLFDSSIVKNAILKLQRDQKALRVNTIGEKIIKIYTAKYDAIHQEVRDFKSMLTTEKMIRRVKAEDCVTLFMLTDLMNQSQITIGQEQRTIKLSDIQPMGETQIQGILDAVQVLEQKLDFFSSDEQGKISQVKLGEWTIFSTDTKVKKQGNFKQLLKDRRLNNLAHYILPDIAGGAIRVRRNLLEMELDQYDRNRIPIIKLMYELEYAIYKVDPFSVELKYKKFSQCLREYAQKAVLNVEQVEHLNVLIAIRNAIMHNQYPNRDHLKAIVPFTVSEYAPVQEGLTIARQLLACAQVSVNIILSTISKFE